MKLLNSGIKRKINSKLSKLSTYHSEIPLKDIFNIIKTFDLIPLQEDDTEWSGFLCGEQSQVYFPLAFRDNDTDTLIKVKNNLCLSWYKMPSGNYEIISYIN